MKSVFCLFFQSSYQQSNRQRRATGDRDKIAWITSGIVSGTIVLMIATACIIHYFKYKYGGVLISKVNEREYGEPQPRPEADGQIDEGSYVSTLNHRNGNSTLNSNGTLNGNGTLSGNGTLNGHKNANGMDSDHLNGRANGHSPTEITELFSKQQTAIYIPQRHSHKATKV